MTVRENPRFTKEYLEEDKRSIGNSVKITFKEGTSIKEEFDYPLGHKKRRAESLPHMMKKIENNMVGHLGQERTKSLIAFFNDKQSFHNEPIHLFMERLLPVK